jgi:tRNA uridine 5-carboxymethylaminomethyl modification enzyme
VSEEKIDHPIRAAALLKRPAVRLDQINQCCDLKQPKRRECIVSIEADIKYSGFVVNQETEVERVKKINTLTIPHNIDYKKVNGLLSESRQKLQKQRPSTLGQASRIPGVTPADISILALFILKSEKEQKSVSRETTPFSTE